MSEKDVADVSVGLIIPYYFISSLDNLLLVWKYLVHMSLNLEILCPNLDTTCVYGSRN